LVSTLRFSLRFCEKPAVLDAFAAGQTAPARIHRVGPDPVFDRCWEALPAQAIRQRALQPGHAEFDVERAIHLTAMWEAKSCSGTPASRVRSAQERFGRRSYQPPGAAPVKAAHSKRLANVHVLFRQLRKTR
jgi:hypothetical protein